MSSAAASPSSSSGSSSSSPRPPAPRPPPPPPPFWSSLPQPQAPQRQPPPKKKKPEEEGQQQPVARPVVVEIKDDDDEEAERKQRGRDTERLDAYACPERIVFCVDSHSSELNSMEMAESGGGKKVNKNAYVKDALNTFFSLKHEISNISEGEYEEHRVGLFRLGAEAELVCPPTDDAAVFKRAVDKLVPPAQGAPPARPCDLTSLLSALSQMKAPTHDDSLRCIVVYARSTQLPVLPSREPETLSEMFPLLKNPFFVMDGIFLHSPDATRRGGPVKPQQVYDALVSLDVTRRGYFFAVGNKASSLFRSVATLLAHPQQRPAQNKFESLKL